MEIFAKRLKELRMEMKITQGQLAKETGICSDTLSKLENCKREPNVYHVYYVAEYFKVSMDFLLGRKDKN